MRANEKSHGGIIKTAKAAIEFAEVILRNENYEGDWKEQLPLIAEPTDEGWDVRGSFNADMKQLGRGPWLISFRRRDAKITAMSKMHNYGPSPIKIKGSSDP